MSRTSALLVALVTSLLAGPIASAAPPPSRLWTERTWATPLDPDAPVSMRAFARLAKELSPTVVFISVTRGGGDPFHGGGSGLGSGFIINADGLVLTNNHVIKDSDNIQVKLANDHVYPARVVGAYPPLDVALLKIDAADEKLAVAPLGDSENLEIGEWVIAIGNPFGLNHTVTAGIVSAKGRRDVVSSGEPMYARFIQTDASINPGNSGGPLINIRGEVVGINTAINAAGQGIGFAVPVEMIKKILPQLATGRVSRSFLGVQVGPVARELADRLHLPRTMGALVRKVLENTPANQAGVKPGDVILSFNGQAVDHWEDLPWLASTAASNQQVPMVVNREGRQLNLTVRLTSYPDGSRAAAEPFEGPGGAGDADKDLGLSVGDLPDALRTSLKLGAGEGVLVTAVAPGSLAESVGIEANDVITQVNYEPVRGTDAFQRAVNAVSAGNILSFTLRRGNRFLFKAFTR
ncbi:MAG: trypsin-like peptidase domain-containing protein [Myxococcales bacterium]|nr:trypsin-like peptidase domain-containing protein [Myxococcales bacterium]MCB9733035.1 trypsin-like peptidase domain-containing protein [Deltaproteobacteria bacterium]